LIHDGIVYLVGDDARVRAVCERTGETLWEVETEGSVRVRPAMVGEILVVGSDDGKLYGLNRVDGAEVWRCELWSPVSGAPAVASGVAACRDKRGAHLGR